MIKLLQRVSVIAIGLLLAGLSHQAIAQTPAPAKQWDYRFGGSAQETLTVLQQTSDGGYILGGSSDSPISGDKTQASQGLEDYWLVKVNASGTKQWDQRFGGTGQDNLQRVQQTSDGGYILGGYSTSGISSDKTQANQGGLDYWVVKLDAAGTKQWDRTVGGNDSDGLTTLQQTSDGGYILGGESSSAISGDKTQGSQGREDYWVVKLAANGSKQWDKTFGGTGLDALASLQQTSDGGYVLAGFTNSPISGDKTQASQGLDDIWVVKLDASGTKQWDRTFGGTGTDFLTMVQQTSDGGYLLGGISDSPISGDKTQASQGRTDYWVLKLTASGTKQWDKTLGGSQYDYLLSLQQTSDGGYVLGGYSNSDLSGDKTQPSQGLDDIWVMKLDGSGTIQWDKTLGGSGNDRAAWLQQTSDGGFILGASSDSGLNGDKTQVSQGGFDYWLVKLGATPLATTAAASRPALSAYPNPARTQLTFRGPLGTPYQLLNQLGQVVRAGHLSGQPLDVQALPAGLYLLRDGTNGHSVRFVKE